MEGSTMTKKTEGAASSTKRPGQAKPTPPKRPRKPATVAQLEEATPTLDNLLNGLRLSPAVSAEVLRVATYLHRTAGSISPADASQLRELAAITQRQEDASTMADNARSQGDADAWGKLCRLLDGLTSQRRGLLRDLKLTRNMQVESPDTVVQRKAKQRSGGKWSGIL
jgi:hypothetical protein